MGLGSAPPPESAPDPLAPTSKGAAGADPELETHRLAAVGTLARGAAHDFNNVLGVILGYVELARMGVGPEQTRIQRQLASALDSVGRARTLADRLLRAARGEDLAEGEADLNACVDDVAGLLGATASPGVRLTVSKKQDVPLLDLRAAVVSQVVLALGSWALGRMGASGELAFETARRVPAQESGRVDDLGECAVLTLRDSGPVPDETQHQPFTEVRALIAPLQGTLACEPEGAGVRTEVWFPTGRTGRGDLPGEAEATPDASGRLHLLVVDDEPGIRGVCRGYLELLGHASSEASTAADAYEALAQRRFDAVLLDLRLPDADGAEVLAAIRERHPEQPVIVMSGDLSRQVRARFPAGTPMLPKPFLMDGLRKVLAEVAGTGTSGQQP